MTKDDFKIFVRTVGNYYGYKDIVNQDRFGLWYAQLKNIPEIALKHISNRIFEDKDSMPRNLPKVVKIYFSEWLSYNPERATSGKANTLCEDCSSTGLLFYEKFSDGRVYRFVARCAACENWKQHFNGGRTGPPGAHPDCVRDNGEHYGVPKLMHKSEINAIN